MKTTLVRKNGNPISVGAGKYVFAIENNKLVIDEAQEAGAKFTGKYNDLVKAYNIAKLAFNNKTYDAYEDW